MRELADVWECHDVQVGVQREQRPQRLCCGHVLRGNRVCEREGARSGVWPRPGVSQRKLRRRHVLRFGRLRVGRNVRHATWRLLEEGRRHCSECARLRERNQDRRRLLQCLVVRDVPRVQRQRRWLSGRGDVCERSVGPNARKRLSGRRRGVLDGRVQWKRCMSATGHRVHVRRSDLRELQHVDGGSHVRREWRLSERLAGRMLGRPRLRERHHL